MIKKEGSKYILYSHDGSKKLGEFTSRTAAEKREREIKAIVAIKEKGNK